MSLLNPDQQAELSHAVGSISEIANFLRAEGTNPGLVDTALILVAARSLALNCPPGIKAECVEQLVAVFTAMANSTTPAGLVQ